MISQVYQSKAFYEVVKYALKKKGARILLASGVRSENHILAAKDFETIRNKAPQVSVAVFHFIISFAHGDIINDALMLTIAEDHLKRLGLKNNQFLLVRHLNTKHDHFHLIVNRISPSGQVANDQFIRNRAANSCDKMEVKFGLTVARDVHSQKQKKNRVHKIQKRKNHIRLSIDEMLTTVMPTNFYGVRAFLTSRNIAMELHVQKTGRINGISFQHDGQSFSGYSIDRRYKYKSLLEVLTFNKSIALKASGKSAPGITTKLLAEDQNKLIQIRNVLDEILNESKSKSLGDFNKILKHLEWSIDIKSGSGGRYKRVRYINKGIVCLDKVLGKKYGINSLRGIFELNEINGADAIIHSRSLYQPETKFILGAAEKELGLFFSKPFNELPSSIALKEKLSVLKIELIIQVRTSGIVSGVYFKCQNHVVDALKINRPIYKRLMKFLKKEAANSAITGEGALKAVVIKNKIQFINEAIRGSFKETMPKHLSDLKKSLSREKIELQYDLLKSGKIGALTYQYKGIAMRATALSNEFSYKSVTKILEKNSIDDIASTLNKISADNMITPTQLIHQPIFDICQFSGAKDFKELRICLARQNIKFELKETDNKKFQIIFISDGSRISGSDLSPIVDFSILSKLFKSNQWIFNQVNNITTSSVSPTDAKKITGANEQKKRPKIN